MDIIGRAKILLFFHPAKSFNVFFGAGPGYVTDVTDVTDVGTTDGDTKQESALHPAERFLVTHTGFKPVTF
ncbi:MAG: hypothetical protein J6C67_01255 [Muribaculaceae bacterium]|nr:hypothetical protein [Muribaculaceae bacterium]